ncbi:MAG: hypothetical protein IGS39_01935 [Calothrix sp. C42_A2020_038]|nr:hypothetical protein [Calothrix sp. C42_A2020_038]
MKIYLQSRGLEKDYNWITQQENNSQEIYVSTPNIIRTATDLIYAQDFSIVLLRFHQELLLLVTGLVTQRQDVYNRKINNSIAWIGKNEDEFLLRSIAAIALENKLERIIDQAVTSSNTLVGFNVNWNIIENEIQQLIPETSKNEIFPSGQYQRKIALLSQARKQELAEELTKYCLPTQEGALVIVTSIKSKEALEESVVWKGLSNDTRISENWQLISQDINNSSNQNNTTCCEFIQNIQNIQNIIQQLLDK